MNYDRIDVLDTGIVWQGGAVDQTINAPPFANTLIVCMDRGEIDESFIDHDTVAAVLAVWIDDTPTGFGPLADNTLRGLAETGKAWLASGGNIYVHCEAGISRASYYDVALHCVCNGWSAQTALAAIKAERPVADPNPGFWAQLTRLWP